VEVSHFGDRDLAHGLETPSLVLRYLGHFLVEQTLFPVLLPDEMLPEPLASGASEADVNIAGAKAALVISLLCYVPGEDPLATVTVKRGPHGALFVGLIGTRDPDRRASGTLDDSIP
jgi:hypothetical protein